MAQSSRPAPLAALDSRSTFWFLVTVVGSFLGFFLVFGPLGWVFGRGLRRDYKALGVRPRAAATATWLIGILMTISGVVTLLFVAWMMMAMMFRW
ncbi:MAG: hypothetical protein AB1Z98_30785 [Nannocystaceae bacterium]